MFIYVRAYSFLVPIPCRLVDCPERMAFLPILNWLWFRFEVEPIKIRMV